MEKTSISNCQFICQLQLTVLHVVAVSLAAIRFCSLGYVVWHALAWLFQGLGYRYRYKASDSDRYLDGHLNNAHTSLAYKRGLPWDTYLLKAAHLAMILTLFMERAFFRGNNSTRLIRIAVRKVNGQEIRMRNPVIVSQLMLD